MPMTYGGATQCLALLVLCVINIASGQTEVQSERLSHWGNLAPAAASAARPSLLSYLNSSSFQKNISSLKIAKSPDALLKWFISQVRAAPIILTFECDHFSEFIKLGYVPNRWELQLRNIGKATYVQNEAETKLMGFPSFTKSMEPTEAEARDRNHYLSINIWKRANGNPRYGNCSVTLRPHLSTKSFVSAVDTGHYTYFCVEGKPGKDCDCNAVPHPMSFGMVGAQPATHIEHLILPHSKFYEYPLSDLFRRMANPANKSAPNFNWYYEAEYSARLFMPEALHYTVACFNTLWGTLKGDEWRTWHTGSHRPLLWSEQKDADRLLLDADVAVTTLRGVFVPLSDILLHGKLWRENGMTFTKAYTSFGPNYHISFLRGEDNEDLCPKSSDCAGTGKICEFLGVTASNKCIWTEEIL